MFSYRWNLADRYPAKNVDYHGLKVYSTFACGGGSTMGYKLAGYDVIGANDIDPQMAKVYQQNHIPKFYDLCPISDLLTKELPQEYYNLDILDGSPPCSTFSTVGSREKAFKKDKVFREGQAKQVLSDLFFDWIALVDRLKPKVAIAENVKGMLMGNAKAYTSLILKEIDKIGYDVQLFCLNGASMGLPQRRERVFFICKRKDLKMPKLVLEFNEKPILFGEIYQKGINDRKLGPRETLLWQNCRPNEKSLVGASKRLFGKENYFQSMVIDKGDVSYTIIASDALVIRDDPRRLNNIELALIGSFPLDYDFLKVQPYYLIGMSVPPVMAAQVAYQVYLQLFKAQK